MAVEQGRLGSVHPLPGRSTGRSEKCRRGMLPCNGAGGSRVKSHGGAARWELETDEKRRFGDLTPIPLAKAEQGGVVSLAAKFQNSELIPKTLTVNHVPSHRAVHSTQAETWTAQIRAAPRGVKHRQIFSRGSARSRCQL